MDSNNRNTPVSYSGLFVFGFCSDERIMIMETMIMEKEIDVAAKWWADQLRQVPKHDNGDAMCNMMASWAADSTRRVITEE